MPSIDPGTGRERVARLPEGRRLHRDHAELLRLGGEAGGARQVVDLLREVLLLRRAALAADDLEPVQAERVLRARGVEQQQADDPAAGCRGSGRRRARAGRGSVSATRLRTGAAEHRRPGSEPLGATSACGRCCSGVGRGSALMLRPAQSARRPAGAPTLLEG